MPFAHHYSLRICWRPAHLRPCVLDSVALSVVLLHLVEKLVVVRLGHPRVSNKDDPVRLLRISVTFYHKALGFEAAVHVARDFVWNGDGVAP